MRKEREGEVRDGNGRKEVSIERKKKLGKKRERERGGRVNDAKKRESVKGR